jgi:2'-5' RNA ligase
MSESTRTFFAIEIPEALGTELRRVQLTLAPETPGCRWVSGGACFHMTLAFLGEVRNRDLPRLQQLVAASVARCEPCDLHFDGLGAFPSARRPRVVWAGLLARDPSLLARIQQAAALGARSAGYACTDDRFHPHVTLGRFKPDRRSPCDLTTIVERYRSWSCGDFTANEVVGFASRPGSVGGPTYQPLCRARLEGEKSEPRP